MREVHPAKCFCRTCLTDESVPITSARWQDIKAAVENPESNKSGEEFVITESDHNQPVYLVAQLRSEQQLPKEFRQFWMWRKEAPFPATTNTTKEITS